MFERIIFTHEFIHEIAFPLPGSQLQWRTRHLYFCIIKWKSTEADMSSKEIHAFTSEEEKCQVSKASQVVELWALVSLYPFQCPWGPNPELKMWICPQLPNASLTEVLYLVPIVFL